MTTSLIFGGKGSSLVFTPPKRAIFYSVFVIVVVDRGCLVIGKHLEHFSVVILNGCNLFSRRLGIPSIRVYFSLFLLLG